MAEVSIVVPTRNSGRTIAACLASARSQHDVEVELIVIDNGSTDATADVAAALADWFVCVGPERSAQRNAGAALAGAPIVLFVDSDMVLEPGVAAQVRDRMAEDARVGGVVLPEIAFGEGFLSRSRALEKRLYLGDPAVEAARAFRREALVEVGGYDERLTAGEDWDLSDRVEAAGWRIGRTAAAVWHDEGRIDLRAQFAKKRYYGRWLPGYLERRTTQRPRSVWRRSLGGAQRKELLRAPVEAFGLAMLKAVEAAGIVVGMWEGRRRGGASLPLS